MKYLVILSLCFFSCAGGQQPPALEPPQSSAVPPPVNAPHSTEQASAAPPVPADQLVIPGERVGKIRLGLTADSLELLLGRPDRSDAAMGKAWLTWTGQRDEHNNATELNIYTTYRDSTMREKSVQQIQFTSPYFRTASGLQVYASLNDLRRQFPHLEKVAQYKTEGRTIAVYDAPSEGIAFELAQVPREEICTGMIVHKKGEPVTSTYLYLHPNMQLEKK